MNVRMAFASFIAFVIALATDAWAIAFAALVPAGVAMTVAALWAAVWCTDWYPQRRRVAERTADSITGGHDESQYDCLWLEAFRAGTRAHERNPFR